MVFYSEDHKAGLEAFDKAQASNKEIERAVQEAIDAAERNRHIREVDAKEPLITIERADDRRDGRQLAIDNLTVAQARKVLDQIGKEGEAMKARQLVLDSIGRSINQALGYKPPRPVLDEDEENEMLDF